MPVADKPVVAHSVRPFLPSSGSWIYNQIVHLGRYRAIALTRRRENAASFPFEPVFAINELSPLARLYQKAFHNYVEPFYPFHLQVLKRENVAVLHSHLGPQAMSDAILLRAARAKNLKIAHVVSWYGADIWLDSRRDGWRGKFLNLAASADLFLVEGNAMRAKVIELGAPPEKVRVFHLGVDLNQIEWLPRRADENGEVRILMAGRAVEKKGFIDGLRAFEKLARKYPFLHLDMIVGVYDDGDECAAELHEFLARHDLQSRVRWTPFLPYREYLQRLREAHIFLQPSRHAANGDAEGGFPVSLLENSAAGLPIVATRHCDIPEAVREGESGLLADENDADGLAQRLEWLLENRDRWEEMGRAGRAHVEREYNIQSQVPILETLYDEVLKRTP